MRLSISPEVERLNGYMEAMSCSLNGCNYVVWFSAREIQLEENDIPDLALESLAIGKNFQEVSPGSELQQLMKLAYPGTKPHLATMVECHHGPPTWLITRVNTFIAQINPSAGFSNVNKHTKRNLCSRFWANVSRCIDYEKSKVLQYNPAFDVDDELWDFIIWGFTYIVINEVQRKCLLIHGGASD